MARFTKRPSPQMWASLKPLVLDQRHHPTVAEQRLWSVLRAEPFNAYKFRRQHAIVRVIADFYCARAGLVIEVDGPIHEKQRDRDTARDDFLEAMGLLVLRLTNEEVLDDVESVSARILEVLEERTKTADLGASEPQQPSQWIVSPKL